MFRIIRNALGRRWAARVATRRAAADTANRLVYLPLRQILVVCYGNIYRSPYLAEYLRSRLPDDRQVRSVGFHPRPGRSSPDQHIEMSGQAGVSLASHTSAVIDQADLDWADTVVFMDRHNWTRLMEMGVDERKMLWAGSLAGGDPEIADPYGSDQEFAQRVISRLAKCGDTLIDRVRDVG